MPTYHYIYLLVSESNPRRHYTGRTSDLARRLTEHNEGRSHHTAKYRPWHPEVAIAFRSRKKAFAFERYLKTHSGRAFSAKHF